MGIKNLSKFVSTKYPGIIKNDTIEILTKSGVGKIAVDTSQIMFRHKSGAIKSTITNSFFMFDNGSWNSLDEDEVRRTMIRYIQRFINVMRKFNVEPLFVFDGKAPDLKKKTQEERLEIYLRQKQKLEEAKYKDDELAYIKALENFCFPTEDDTMLYKKAIKESGCSIIQAHGEAEGVCCYLCKKDYVQAVYSTDFDLFAYGDVIMIKEIDINQAIPQMKFIYSDVFEQVLSLDRNQMLDYCIMCGTDYNKNIPSYSSVKCLELITKYKSLEEICQKEEDFREFSFQEVRTLFLTKPKYDIVQLSDVFK